MDRSNHALAMLCLAVLIGTTPVVAAPPEATAASFDAFDQRARSGDVLNVVCFGGSLTWGANASDPQRTSYRALMGQYLRDTYPKASFTFHDAAIGGTGSALGMFRLERDVLSRNPDLVFLDFTANDNLTGRNDHPLASYEILLRELVGRGIPVVQVFLGFKSNFGPQWNPDGLHRVKDHKRLAEAYNTATGDCFPHVQSAIEKGADRDAIWPLDGAHPDDLGYRLFFEAVRDGFEQAVAEKRICRVPAEPVFSDKYKQRQRIRLIDLPAPPGWKRSLTYRTSLWFDGLSSRWMDDVLKCSAPGGETVAPLRITFTGTFVGLFGEADEKGLGFRAVLDGQPILHKDKAGPTEIHPFNTKRFGTGRLFIWRELASDLQPGEHVLEIYPAVDPENPSGELRIESICVAGRSGADAR